MAEDTWKMDPPDVIGARILQERNRLMMTQEELGEALGCTENYIGQLERGTRRISLRMAEKIACFFGISYDYLLCGTEPFSSAQLIREQHNYEENAQIFSLLEHCTQAERRLCLDTIRTLIRGLRSPGR